MADVFNPKVILLMILFMDILPGSMCSPKNRRRRKNHSNRVTTVHRPLLKVHNFSRVHLQTNSPTNRRIVTLISRTGFCLQVNRNRTPGGSYSKGRRAHFELQSMATSIVRLKNVSTKLYLAINKRGRVKLQRQPNDDCLFMEFKEESFFHSFASHKYYKKQIHDIFIGIKTNGDIKSPRTTAPGQKAVLFLYMAAKPT